MEQVTFSFEPERFAEAELSGASTAAVTSGRLPGVGLGVVGGTVAAESGALEALPHPAAQRSIARATINSKSFLIFLLSLLASQLVQVSSQPAAARTIAAWVVQYQ